MEPFKITAEPLMLNDLTEDEYDLKRVPKKDLNDRCTQISLPEFNFQKACLKRKLLIARIRDLEARKVYLMKRGEEEANYYRSKQEGKLII